jgi:hypothetical protein
MSVTAGRSATYIGVFSAPVLPRAPSSLQPHVNKVPFEARATVCIPPQIIFIIDLPGNTSGIEKISGFLGFFISNGASSPRPKSYKMVSFKY